jgi:predicted RNA binding protein YcfA (HicA-like mRNA interferase family)
LKLGRLKPQPFREVKRRLETVGFEEISQKGSHVKFARRQGATVDTAIVPRKHEIPVGTLRSILNQAHIDQDVWESL